MRAMAVVGLGGVMALTLSCRTGMRSEMASGRAPEGARALKMLHPSPELHNVFEAAPGVYSGSAPVGPGAFEALRAMGVRTIISVDGATPDVALAESAGMRYAHVPIGYDGVGEDATLQIARALRDLDGPVYVHCHHGKHRGPAAAAAGLIALGRIDNTAGDALLSASGTSPSYPGLWASVRECEVQSASAIDAAPEAPSVAPVGGFVAGMALIDRAWDHLKLCKANAWRTPADHPDLVPAAEAGMVADTLRQLNQAHEVLDQPDDFIAWMRQSQSSASELERLIIAGAPRSDTDAAFTTLAATCKACHVKYRNE